MAFTGNFLCTSFKVELLAGTHNFTTSTGDTFKLALYDNSASFTAATTAYTATNEVSWYGLQRWWRYANERDSNIERHNCLY
jgi:hypothetical protein